MSNTRAPQRLHFFAMSRPRLGGLRGGQRSSRLPVGTRRLGPDRLPIVGAQIFAGDCPARGALNAHTPLDRNRTNSFRPLPDELRLRTYGSCQFGLAPVR